jgi:hypothetical protein
MSVRAVFFGGIDFGAMVLVVSLVAGSVVEEFAADDFFGVDFCCDVELGLWVPLFGFGGVEVFSWVGAWEAAAGEVGLLFGAPCLGALAIPGFASGFSGNFFGWFSETSGFEPISGFCLEF